MKYLIFHHHVLYTCTDRMNISMFITASSRYLNFALSCAKSDQPKDTVPLSPTTYEQKRNLSNIYNNNNNNNNYYYYYYYYY